MKASNETTTPPFDIPKTLALLAKATEIDPEAWAMPLPDKFGARRTDSVWRAKTELEDAIDGE